MDWYRYSVHAIERMVERDISKEEVEAILNEGVDSVVVPSKMDKTVYLVLGFVGGRGIAIIINSKTNKIITVRPLRDNEKKLVRGGS